MTTVSEELTLDFLYLMAHKEGIGKLLDNYSLKRVESRGSGMRESIQWTVSVCISTRGHNHLTGHTEVATSGLRSSYPDELLRRLAKERYGDPDVFVDRWSPNPKKALHVRDHENESTLCDMTGVCKFASHWWFFEKGWGIEDFARLLSTATGVDFSVEELNQAAEREILLERAFNAREGIRRIDNYPFAFHYKLKYGEEHPYFDFSNLEITLEDYDKLLDEYYRVRGCDREGIPARQRLEQLDLKDVADDLENYGIGADNLAGIDS